MSASRYFWTLLLSVVLFPSMLWAQSETTPPDPWSETVLFDSIPSAHDAPKFEQEESVSGASKFKQKQLEAPSSISIITASDIKKYGYRSLADVLQSLPGFYIGNDRNYSFIGARGFGRPGDYNTRVLLLVDGHRINDNVYDQAPVGWEFPIDIDLIDRVEVIRGPSSSIYGSNAFLGVINVITRNARDFKGAELSGELGSFETYKGRLSYGNKLGSDLEMVLSGSYANSAGQDLYFEEFDRPETNGGIAGNCDDESYYGLFSKFLMNDLTLEGVLHSREKGVPTGAWETLFNNPGTRTYDRRAYLDLRYDRKFEDLGVEAHLYYDHYEYEGTYMYNAFDRDGYRFLLTNKDFSAGDWVGGDIQLKKKFFDAHQVILGTEYKNNFSQDQENYDDNPFQSYLNDKRSNFNWAAYLQDEFRFHEKWILNAGVRYDYYDLFGGTVNPRLALIYLPSDKTALKLLYGTAFRAPNAYELYYTDGDKQKPNPDLKPEEIETYELVWEQYIGDHLRLNVSGYYYTIEDLISQKKGSHGLLTFQNIQEVEAKGVEIGLEGLWPGEIATRIGYAAQETASSATGRLTNSPQHMAKFNLTFPLLDDKLFAGLELRYMSPLKTLAGNETEEAFITNVTLFSHNIVKRLEVSASIYNLFDYDYGIPGSGEHPQDVIEQDGRSFRIKFTYSF